MCTPVHGLETSILQTTGDARRRVGEARARGATGDRDAASRDKHTAASYPLRVVRACLYTIWRASSGSTRPRLKKSSSARSRAMLRLQPARHAQHLGERKKKRKTAPKTMRDVGQQRACHVESDWQRHEVERQITVRTTGERPLNSLHSISHAQFLTHRS